MHTALCLPARLALLALLLPAGFLLAAPPDPPAAVPLAERAEQRLEKGLDQPITAAFLETPLAEVVQALGQKSGLPLLIDKKGLADVGIGTDAPVNFTAKGSSLRPALRRMLRDVDLTFVVRDEVVLITTPEEAFSRLVARIHPLPKVFDQCPEEERGPHIALLKSIVLSTVAPTTWEDVGGPGALTVFRGQLIVNQTSEVQEEVVDVLDLLEQAHRRASEPVRGPAGLAPLRHRSEVEQKILAALGGPAEGEWVETPLKEVAEKLAAQHKIPIEFDRKALADVGIGIDTPVTFQLRGTTLRMLLVHLLKNLDLTYMLRDDVLLITTPEECNCKLVTQVYPISDLVTLKLQANLQNPDRLLTGAEELIALLAGQVAPTTWDEVGGPGSMTALVYPPVLVVSQTDEVHHDLAEILTRLREKTPLPPATPSKPVERVYVLLPPIAIGPDRPGHAPTAEELAKLLQELVEPASWKGEGIYVKSVTGRLIVRQHPAAHQRIEKLLADLQVFEPPTPPPANVRRGFGSGGFSGMGSGNFGF